MDMTPIFVMFGMLLSYLLGCLWTYWFFVHEPVKPKKQASYHALEDAQEIVERLVKEGKL
jgi:hypothetical protein